MSNATEARIEMGKALSALGLEVHESIAGDVDRKVRAAIIELENKITELHERLKAADKVIDVTNDYIDKSYAPSITYDLDRYNDMREALKNYQEVKDED